MRAWNECFGKLRTPRLWEAGGILPEVGRDLAEVGAQVGPWEAQVWGSGHLSSSLLNAGSGREQAGPGKPHSR